MMLATAQVSGSFVGIARDTVQQEAVWLGRHLSPRLTHARADHVFFASDVPDGGPEVEEDE